MGSPRQLRRGSCCTVSGLKKFFRKVFLYLVIVVARNYRLSVLWIMIFPLDLFFFGCRSLRGLSYARFGDVFTKYNPPTRNQNSFRFVI
jgi:hypothetical protein